MAFFRKVLNVLKNNNFLHCVYLYFLYFFADHVNGEMDFSKALNRLGETLIMREDSADYGSDDIGAAFQKFSVVTKELSNLMKTLVSPIFYTIPDLIFEPFDVLERFFLARSKKIP